MEVTGGDVKYTSQLQSIDVRTMVRDLFLQRKEYAALEMIYNMSSKTLHRAIPTANYLAWGSLRFVLNTLEKKINGLNPKDAKLERIITKLKNEGKLCIVPSKWYK